MNKKEALIELREIIDDVAHPYKWSDIRLLSLMADGEDEFCEETGYFVDSTTYTIDLKTGVSSYKISDRIIQVLDIKDGTRKLIKVAEFNIPSTYVDTQQLPSYWQPDQETDSIIFYPTPDKDYNGFKLRVWCYSPIRFDNKSVEEFSIREQSHRAPIVYAAKKVYKDNDAETASKVKAIDYENEWKDYISKGIKAFRRNRGVDTVLAPSIIYNFQ